MRSRRSQPSGVKTAKGDIDLIERRLHEAGCGLYLEPAGLIGRWIMRRDTGNRSATRRRAEKENRPRVLASSGNVFADLGRPLAEEKLTKVRLAAAINQIIEGRNLSQMAAARRLHVNQPKVSALANYQLDGFSVERLMNLLTALDRDVEIVIRPKPRSRKAGRIVVRAA